jgi:hypothetical protein
MSNSNVDEDWESAGLNLESLKIKSEEVSTNDNNKQAQKDVSSVFALPQRLMTNDIQFMRSDLKPIATPIAFNNEPIDQVIIDAANNPRERMNVLNIENSILTFVKSNEKTLEIPPLHNSFKRLITYRIAQRFLLFHTNSDNMNEGGDTGIVLHKTPETSIPNQLIIDYKDCSNDDNINNLNNNINNNGNATTPVVAPVKKMMVLKRNPNSNENLKKGIVNNRQNKSDSDKEKAYAEARARIFGEEAAIEGGNVDDSNSNRAVPPAQVNNQVNIEQESISNQSINRIPSSEFLGDNDNYSENKSNKKAVDTSSWKKKKSLTRDRFAEQSDPDFARSGNNVSLNYQPQQMNNNNYDQYNDRNGGDYNNQVPYIYNNSNQYPNLAPSNPYVNQSGASNPNLWPPISHVNEFNNSPNHVHNNNQIPYYQQNNHHYPPQGYQYPPQQQQQQGHQNNINSRENLMNNADYPPLN